MVAALTLPLLLAVVRLARAGMLAVALALLGIVLASMLLNASYGDVIGYSGVARLVAFAMIAYGLLRFAPFGGGSTPVRDARVVLAPAAIALVFIVAEVAQSFVSAQYGLLIGGAVAGALLFSAEPLQRALGRGGAVSRAATIYRASLRAALADGAMTEQEELHLAEVQEHLGLAAREAARLRHEVERELGLRT